ncbi:MAG TPA: TfuA-like protein, partial [Polyangiaceae bacterium]|nr:TfuA-like protein [Polyangiaceae bacterium]
MQLPIVFVGPSLPVEEARRFLEADYRRPIRRGDLTEIEPERVVGIIDGVFDQDLAVSPREVKSAIGRGVRVFGSSSMGALRAAEVPGVVGVGRVFEMFRSGALEDDDEVAITFDPDTHRPLCEPMVNVRYAVERLVTPGTISREAGSAIVRAAKALPYRDRTYPHILRSAGLGQRADAKVLQSMLSAHDLKREDAITLLEVLPRASQCKSEAVNVCLNDEDDRPDTIDNALTLPANAPVHCWEFGPPIAFEELTRLLMFTGELPKHARAAASRFLLQGNSLDGAFDAGSGTAPSPEQVGTRVLERLSAEWSFFTDEEARVSVADFGIGALSFEDCVDEEIAAERRVMALVREGSVEFQRALRMQLFLDDLALKRAAARCSSLTELAALVAPHELREQDRAAALVTICAALDVRDRGALVRELSWWGREPEELEQFVELLARARLAHQRRVTAKAKNRVRPLNGLGLLRRQLKPAGELRFSYPARLAARHIRRLCKVVGITRVSSITGLSDLGIPNAQAFRPDGQFSSTVGSGKSESVSGARIGAVMEEVEKWAQEQYALSAPAPARIASYTTLRAARRLVVDPRSLDLPYDTCYQPELDLQWHACHDLISGRPVLVPTAALTPERLPQDIYFSPRAARKQFSTNGLASGFNLEDALCHAMCEYIERHADVLHEIGMGNPGVRPEALATLIDPQSVPRSTTRLIRKIEASGRSVRLFDIRSDIRVPTFRARIGSA